MALCDSQPAVSLSVSRPIFEHKTRSGVGNQSKSVQTSKITVITLTLTLLLVTSHIMKENNIIGQLNGVQANSLKRSHQKETTQTNKKQDKITRQ